MSPSPIRSPAFPRDGGPARERGSRALGIGLAISLVLHVIAILLYSAGPASRGLPPASGAPDRVERTASGIELLDLQEVPELAEEPPQEADAPAVPEPEVEVIPDVVVEETGGPAEEEDEAEETEEVEEVEEEPTLTLAERLQPRMGDPKIWAGIAPSHTELTDFERAELLLHGMIQSWNDSLAVAEALADRGRDWTYTDSDGGRWGLASGRLYLGDFSIPLPFTFDVSPDRRRAWAERRWTAQDLARGAATAAIREEWVDRARIMRERLEAERDAARSDGDGRDGG